VARLNLLVRKVNFVSRFVVVEELFSVPSKPLSSDVGSVKGHFKARQVERDLLLEALGLRLILVDEDDT